MLTTAPPPPQAIIVSLAGQISKSPSAKNSNFDIERLLNHPIKNFIDKHNLTKKQHKVLQDIYISSHASDLSTFNLTLKEDEVALTRATPHSLNYIIIDEDGDVLLSHISVANKNADFRKFYEFKDTNAEEILYLLLLNK
jgi:hypothetical protein